MQVNAPLILQLLQQRLPHVLAVYAFGSQVEGNATADSDLDLAVLVEGYVDVVELWDISGDIADAINCDVDLLDFRAATTVMQYQILSKGQRWFARDSSVDCYEATLLSAMTALNEARAGVLADIREEGSIYGKR